MDIPCFVYHSNTIIKTDFDRQVEYLRNNRFQIISWKEIIKPDAGSLTSPVMLTFDDGYLSDFGAVFPVLKEAGLKAHFFIGYLLIV